MAEAILRLHIRGFRNHSNTPINIESAPSRPFAASTGRASPPFSSSLLPPTKRQQTASYYVSGFILAGTLDQKPFADDASVEVTYAEPPASDGKLPTRTLTISRSASAWSGYDPQPERPVSYLGLGFHLPHSERDEVYKSKVQDKNLILRYQVAIQNTVLDKISAILLCSYGAAHRNILRKKYARRSMDLLSAKRSTGEQYSEANMGSGEARLYDLVTRIETFPEKSLLLIEEPETALHPSAQFELGRYLVEVSKRRGIQFLLTTHSEYVLLALPQKSRIYLKRENNTVMPIPGIGVRQAISLMDNLEMPAIYILVEDDVGEAVVAELLRRHDPDLLKTVRILIAGSKDKLQDMAAVFHDQKLPVCAVRDGDFGANPKIKMFKLFGSEAPEKAVFKSATFRSTFTTAHKIDFGTVDITNRSLDHHHWFDVLVVQMARKRAEILPAAAAAYLDGVPESERMILVEQIKASVP